MTAKLATSSLVISDRAMRLQDLRDVGPHRPRLQAAHLGPGSAYAPPVHEECLGVPCDNPDAVQCDVEVQHRRRALQTRRPGRPRRRRNHRRHSTRRIVWSATLLASLLAALRLDGSLSLTALLAVAPRVTTARRDTEKRMASGRAGREL